MQIKLHMFLSFIIIFLCFGFRSNASEPSIKWKYDLKDASFGQSAAGDIDGDGKYEIVFGCYRNDSCVYALNAEDGTLLWKYNTHSNGAEGCNDVAPIIYDIDGDNNLDVIVPSSCNPITYCFDGKTGAVKWQCKTRGSDSPPTIADIDNDGKPEIIHGEFAGYVICINGEDGTISWEIAVDMNSWVQTAPTIVDLDNNGQLDFVVGTWSFKKVDSIYAYRGDNQKLLWTYPVHDYIYHGTAVADLDNDALPELLIGSYNDTLYCLNGENGTLNWKFAGPGYVGAPASIGDIDNDGICDIVIASGNSVIALSNNGIKKWEYKIPGYQGVFRGVALADVNNDNYLDVTFGTGDGQLIALNGNNGEKIWLIDLATDYGDSKFSIDNAPLIADFDGDDSLEVFIIGGHGEYPDIRKGFGRAYMLDIGKGKGPEWTMFQHDIRRQSSLCDITVGVQSENYAKNKILIDISPNPSNSLIKIKFNNLELKNKTFAVYNILGQEIFKVHNPDENEISINTSLWQKGIYFYKLKSKSQNISEGKFLVE